MIGNSLPSNDNCDFRTTYPKDNFVHAPFHFVHATFHSTYKHAPENTLHTIALDDSRLSPLQRTDRRVLKAN